MCDCSLRSPATQAAAGRSLRWRSGRSHAHDCLLHHPSLARGLRPRTPSAPCSLALAAPLVVRTLTPLPLGGCAPGPHLRLARWRSRRRSSFARSLLHKIEVGVWTAIAVERPTVTDELDLVNVEIANDQLGLERIAHIPDELALGVDEVALTVEVVLADLGLDTHPLDRPDLVHVVY